MIRSTKIKSTHANKSKLVIAFSLLSKTIDKVISDLVNDMINNYDKIPALPSKQVTDQLPYGARINQLLAKEASANARSIRNKIKKIEWYQKKGIDLKDYQIELVNALANKTLKVEWNGNLNLDSRFVSIEKSNNSFDYWINLKLTGQDRVYLQFKITRHMQNLIDRGYQLKLNSLKICKNKEIILFFEKDEVENTNSKAIGIDVGRNKSFVTSDNICETNTVKILNTLKKKKHGSNNKASHVRKLKQAIDKEIKAIDFKSLKSVTLEDLTNMKYKSKKGNINHHWSYSYIQNRIEQQCQEHNVCVIYIRPNYTSQECSTCGVIDKSARNKQEFECNACHLIIDADHNAAIVILHRGTNSANVTKRKYI